MRPCPALSGPSRFRGWGSTCEREINAPGALGWCRARLTDPNYLLRVDHLDCWMWTGTRRIAAKSTSARRVLTISG